MSQLSLRLLPLAAALVLAGPAAAQDTRTIVVENDCNHPLRLLIEHADGYRNWHPHAWFQFDPDDRSTLTSVDDVTLGQTEGHELYYYAETTDGSDMYWEGEDSTVEFEGTTYRLAKANTAVESGDLVMRLTCDD